MAVLDLKAGLSRDAGSGVIFRGGTGLWLIALPLDLGSVLALRGTGWLLEGHMLTQMVHARLTMQMQDAKMWALW